MMFNHPAHIPVTFAMAVYNIMHNSPTDQNWAAIDEYKAQALGWIEEILISNGSKNMDREMEWWRNQGVGEQ